MKELLGFKAKGRNVIEGRERYQLREASVHYKALLGTEKDDIAPESTCFWAVNTE